MHVYIYISPLSSHYNISDAPVATNTASAVISNKEPEVSRTASERAPQCNTPDTTK